VRQLTFLRGALAILIGTMDRLTASYTVFYRTSTREGGYICRACGAYRHGAFEHVSDAFAVATQHLTLCRASLRQRPVEGFGILDGMPAGLVLREGLMVVALPTIGGSRALRMIA
jgi:hypothetical protein